MPCVSRKSLWVLVLTLAIAGCNKDSGSPTQPTPTTQPSGSVTYSLQISVRDTSGQGIGAATITILDGQFAGQMFSVDANGGITITGARGDMNIEASAAGFRSGRLGVGPPSISGGTQIVNFVLERTAASFGPGTHLVNDDIEPGRYFADPDPSCFWARLSGLSGGIGDTIANEFIGGDWDQEVVDIAFADRAFRTDPECGRWSKSRPRGAQTTIPPGRWVVGVQVNPGTYRAQAQPGCFWERLSNFSGVTSSGTIANDFIVGGGQVLVTILPGDRGFGSNSACGTWMRQ
jgi:hypothetical protein